MADQAELNGQAIEAAAELLAASTESHSAGVGYLMALSRWRPDLYEETAQVVIATGVSMLRRTSMPAPGIVLLQAQADGLPDPLPPRLEGALDSLKTLDALLNGRPAPGMDSESESEYWIGWWTQQVSMLVALRAEQMIRDREEKARQN